MATNVVIYGQRPAWPVDACTGAHVSNELAYEGGKIGVAVETNSSGQPNTFIEHGVVILPVPGSTAKGTKLYIPTASLVDGATLQAMNAGYRKTAIATSLQVSPTSATLVGTMMEASTAYGATTAAKIELAPQ